jgi:membrane associated rhomboid family serine protease
VIPLSDGIPARRVPVVNVALIAANVAAWIFYELPHVGSSIAHASFYPCSLSGACHAPEPWDAGWFTAMFMHGSWNHILGDMLFVAIFGKNVEDAFGHLRYLVLYLAGGFAAAMTQALITLAAGSVADARVPMLGASGAIAAVLGAYFVLYPYSRVLALAFVFPVRLPAWVFLGVWFVFQLIEGGFGLVSAGGQRGGTAFFAHVGGFVVGVLAARHFVQVRARQPVYASTERNVVNDLDLHRAVVEGSPAVR